MFRLLFLCCSIPTLLLSQQKDTQWESLRFADLHSVQIEVATSGTANIFNEESLRAKVFAELQRLIPTLKIDASAPDQVYLEVNSSEITRATSTTETFYLGSLIISLRRPAKLFLSQKYYRDTEPIYWANVWERGGAFWGGKEYLIKTASAHIEDAIGVLAYSHAAAINELQKAIQNPANK